MSFPHSVRPASLYYPPQVILAIGGGTSYMDKTVTASHCVALRSFSPSWGLQARAFYCDASMLGQKTSGTHPLSLSALV